MDLFTINIITLAYLGDAIYEVYVREHLISTGVAMVDELQKEAIKYVSAKSQSRILTNLIDNDYLTEEEKDIVKRGRNYKRNTHPKNTDIITYKLSTGYNIGYTVLPHIPQTIFPPESLDKFEAETILYPELFTIK